MAKKKASLTTDQILEAVTNLSTAEQLNLKLFIDKTLAAKEKAAQDELALIKSQS